MQKKGQEEIKSTGAPLCDAQLNVKGLTKADKCLDFHNTVSHISHQLLSTHLINPAVNPSFLTLRVLELKHLQSSTFNNASLKNAVFRTVPTAANNPIKSWR